MLPADGGGIATPTLGVPPGDPDTLSAAAHALQRTADLLSHTGPDIAAASRRVLADGEWTGPAADRFTARGERLSRQADQLAPPLQTIAAAVEVFAAALRSAQAKARTAVSLAQTAHHVGPVDGPAALAGAKDDCAAAWAAYESALAVAVAAVAGAESEFPQQQEAPPVPTEAGGSERQAPSLVELADKVNSKLGFLVSPLAAAAATRESQVWMQALRTFSTAPARALPAQLVERWAAVGEAGLAYDRGEISLAELAAVADRTQPSVDAAIAFSRGVLAPERVPALRTGGIPEGGWLDMAGRGLALAGVASDVMTLVNPGTENQAEGDVNRGMAAANMVGTGMAFAPAIVGAAPGAAALVGINAVADWVPVAGQVVMAGTALYLAGDWAYHNWDSITHAAGTAEHFIASGIEDTYQADKAVVEGGVHLAEHIGGEAVQAGKSLVHDAGSVVKHLNPFSW